MLVHLRRLLGQTAIYGIGDAVTRVAALLLLPLYTRVLTPADYGILALVGMVTTVVGIILDSGIRSAFFRYYYKTEAQEDRRVLTGTALVYLLVSAALIVLPLAVFFNRLASSFVKEATSVPLVQIALIGTYFDIGSAIPFATFRAEQRARQYAKLSVLRFSINVSLNIIAVAILHWGVRGVIYANVFSSMLFFVACLRLTLPNVEWAVDRELLKQLLRFGLPMVPANLAAWALALSNRLFLERYQNLALVGIYSLGFSIAGVVNMIMGWFNTAWAPYCYSVSKQHGAKAMYARVLTYGMLSFSLIGFVLSLFAGEVVRALAQASYNAAAKVVPMLVLSYLFFEFNYLVAFGLDLTNKTKYYPCVMGAGALFSVALNLALIPPFGMLGAAGASMLSYLGVAIIEYILVQRVYPVSYEWRRLATLAAVSLGVYVAAVMCKTGQLLADVGIGIVFIMVWGVVLKVAGFFTAQELLAARGLLAAGGSMMRTRLQQFIGRAW